MVLKDAVDSGRVRFPLSAAHYFETGKHPNPRKRSELATTMMRLAGPLRISPPHQIVPWEIRRGLIKIFHLPAPDPALQMFGNGAAQAFASHNLRYLPPKEWHEISLPSNMKDEIHSRASREFETLLLAGATPAGAPDAMRVVFHDMKTLTDDRFVQGQLHVAEAIRQYGRRHLDEVMLATAVADIHDPLTRIGAEYGLTFEDIAARMTGIIDSMPSRWVEMKLRRQRQANPEKTWEGNDLNDVAALAIAVPYCDLVVTERSWSAMLNDAKVPDRFGHRVSRSLHDLTDLLLSA